MRLICIGFDLNFFGTFKLVFRDLRIINGKFRHFRKYFGNQHFLGFDRSDKLGDIRLIFAENIFIVFVLYFFYFEILY